MSRTFVSFPLSQIIDFKKQCLFWASQFNVSCFLDNNHYSLRYGDYECMLAAGARYALQVNAGDAFEQLKSFYDKHQDWVFGHFGYDLKNELERLVSVHPDGIDIPDLFFFVPEVLILLTGNEILISSPGADANHIFQQIKQAISPSIHQYEMPVSINARYSKESYIATVNELLHHIHRGNCYEVNFCQEFFSEEAHIDPLRLYLALNELSPNPFAAYYRINNKYLCCASPERYLKKEGNLLISQPVKGTVARNQQNEAADEQNRKHLLNSAKERSENVMVVDLVRNDLSKICEEGTVQVNELFGIYSFPQVHQMISTISGILQKDVHCLEAVKATFPMGSMTGAPKKRVMELIERYEKSKRGLFSGALGYISPTGDFDFNVVIRSVLYNKERKYLSYMVGSAITFYSDASSEYEECLLKAAAIKEALASLNHPHAS